MAKSHRILDLDQAGQGTILGESVAKKVFQVEREAYFPH